MINPLYEQASKLKQMGLSRDEASGVMRLGLHKGHELTRETTRIKEKESEISEELARIVKDYVLLAASDPLFKDFDFAVDGLANKAKSPTLKDHEREEFGRRTGAARAFIELMRDEKEKLDLVHQGESNLEFTSSLITKAALFIEERVEQLGKYARQDIYLALVVNLLDLEIECPNSKPLINGIFFAVKMREKDEKMQVWIQGTHDKLAPVYKEPDLYLLLSYVIREEARP